MRTYDSSVFVGTACGLLAAKEIYNQYRVNGKEFQLLCCIAGYLETHQVSQVSIKVVEKWLRVNLAYRRKNAGYLSGLIRKGCIEEVINKQGTKSVKLTDYGDSLLDRYLEHLEELEEKALEEKLSRLAKRAA